jgi:dTDP-4-dehydrorhamnose 3,5-epimerase
MLNSLNSKLVLIKTRRHRDDRGWFSEVYSRDHFETVGLTFDYVQDNHSMSLLPGTVRGLHFQSPPFAQAKLVRCISGSIFDVAVDIRKASPTYGRWIGVKLTAENGHQLSIPIGFAHGFLTLEPNSEVSYKISHKYSPEHDGGIRWDDPGIGIDWSVGPALAPLLSNKDKAQPLLCEFDSPFEYDGTPLELVEV